MNLIVEAISDTIFDFKGTIEEEISGKHLFVKFSDKVNSELKELINSPLSVSDALYAVRFKIMEEHDKFSNYLWFLHSNYKMLNNATVYILIATIFYLPHTIKKSSDWNIDLAYFVQVIAVLITIYLSKKLIARIKKPLIESLDNSIKLWHFVLFLFMLLGLFLNSMNTDFGRLIGIDCLIFIVVFFTLVGSFTQRLKLRSVYTDAFIALRYRKNLFGEDDPKDKK